MIDWIVFGLIILAFIGIAFWEASVEGKHGWGKKQYGWQIYPSKTNKFKRFIHNFFLGEKPLTMYHIWLFGITIPTLLLIPFVLVPTWAMAKTILAGYFIRVVVEDYLWFWVNPVFSIPKQKSFSSKKATWHRWVRIGNFEIPDFYIVYTLIGILLLCVF